MTGKTSKCTLCPKPICAHRCIWGMTWLRSLPLNTHSSAPHTCGMSALCTMYGLCCGLGNDTTDNHRKWGSTYTRKDKNNWQWWHVTERDTHVYSHASPISWASNKTKSTSLHWAASICTYACTCLGTCWMNSGRDKLNWHIQKLSRVTWTVLYFPWIHLGI
jgi:hypothetical protein